MEPKRLPVFLLFIVPALGGLLFGYDIGASSYAVDQLVDVDLADVSYSQAIADSSALKGLVTSAATIGAFLGSSVVFKVADTIGRKNELVLGSSLYFTGSVLMFLSAFLSVSSNFDMFALIFARVIYGIGIGFSMHGAPTYIAEMAPPTLRGLLVSLKEAFIVVGILAGYVIGYVLKDTLGGWKYMYGASSVVAAVMFIGTFAIPKSARFLLLSGAEESEVMRSINFVFSGNDTMELYDEMKTQVDEQKEEQRLAIESGDTSRTNIFSKRWRGPLIAGTGLVLLQQVTGQPSILSYTQPIFNDAGLASYSSVLVGVFKFFATMFSVVFVDKYGRRKLLFIGCSLMLVALITLSINFLFTDDSDDSTDDDTDTKKTVGFQQITTLIAMFVYIGGYQVGFGPIAWLMISECFPLEIRGAAVAFAVQTNFLSNSVVQFTVPVLQDKIGNFAMFSIFSVLCAYSILFVKQYVPETKGLSLEEIEKFFEKKRQNEKGRSRNNSSDPTKALLSAVV